MNTKKEKPNIILILADDMGYSDLGCFGSDIKTPNLDKLAKKGMKFTQFYNAARCCPSRASLLTGLYPHQAGMGWMTAANLGTDGYTGQINDQCKTIAEYLKSSGYGTYMSGKWHLTYKQNLQPGSDNDSWPCQRGFDKFFGTLKGADSYFKPDNLFFNNKTIEIEDDFYYTEAIADYSCDFINSHLKQNDTEKPFFLYTSFTAPHWPLHAREKDIEEYRGKYKAGWDKKRKIKFSRMQKKGILDENWSLSERDPEVSAWDSYSKEKKDYLDKKMAIYAAQITAMDRGIGRIIDCLKAGQIMDNTLIIFLSDNGGCHEEIGKFSFDIDELGTEESFESYGRGWANLSNTPFREFKSWVHEGGIATPLILHWPDYIEGENVTSTQVGHIVDLVPTILEATGTNYPDEPGFKKPVGQSLLQVMKGQEIKHDVIFWEHEANRALRKGKWKIVAKGKEGSWELYDLEKDRSELNNQAEKKQNLVQNMAKTWDNIAREINVYPLDGRSWGERLK